MAWEKISTIGATAGTDLKESDGTVLADNAIRNEDLSISQGNSGVLTLNRGAAAADTTTITKAKLNLSYDDGATVGAVFGTNLFKTGTTNFTAAELKNDSQVWSDVGGSGKPADNATVGAVFGTNLYKTGTTNFTAAELKNDSQVWSDVGGTGKPADNATVGAIAGTNLKAANGTTTLGDDDVKNSALDVDISGTAIKLKIGSTETSTVTASQGLVGLSGVANNATVGAIAGTNLKDSSNNSLGDEDVRNSDLSLAYSGTNIQIKKGSTQIGSNLDSPTALKNNQITTNANGTLNNAGGGTAPSLASITGIVGKAGGGMGEDISSATGILRMASGTLNKDAALSTTYTDATDNGTTINTSGNIAGTVDIASGGSITVGNITIDGTNNRILITD